MNRSETTPARLDPPERVESAHLGWFLRLRWLLLFLQTVVVGWMIAGLRVPLEVSWILGVVLLGVGSNVALWAWRRRGGRIGERTLLAAMLADIGLWTAYLTLTGGPFNPFSVVYLIHVVLGAVVLGRPRSWVVFGASFLAFGSLFWLGQEIPAEALALPTHADLMKLHLTGMLLAFAVVAAFIVYFVGRLQSVVLEHRRQLEEAGSRAARFEKLAALSTLAAGAAHELSTPLGTIAVVAKDLEGLLGAFPSGAEMVEDMRLIRSQVERCRAILHDMAAGAGTPAGEAVALLCIGDWVRDACSGVADEQRIVRSLPDGALFVRGPRKALTRALRDLLKNAIEASLPAGEVRLLVCREDRQLRVDVVDAGEGIPEELMPRIGEPFFTTKQPGRGLGLGVFLARTVVDDLGGSLDYSSQRGVGTTVRLRMPLASDGAA